MHWTFFQRRKRRRKKPRLRRPELSVPQILAWADEHHRRTGQWPIADSGLIPGTLEERWVNVNQALRLGLRGLPGGSSLARLLAEHRGVRNAADLSPLTAEQVLAWADAHRARTGEWPTTKSGPIPEAPGETWVFVNVALQRGYRGLPGGSSLPRLLAERRSTRNRKALPPLTEEQILCWADAHHHRTGQWPLHDSGPVVEAAGETWTAVDSALRQGLRGLPGGSSLARLLAKRRGVRNHLSLPPFTLDQILAWADAHYERTGEWPTRLSGPIAGAPGETWMAVNSALVAGVRGLPGRETLAQLLAEHRGFRNLARLPPLTVEQVLAWADAYHQRTGRWPTHYSGPIAEAPGETWVAVDASLRVGRRGLPRGSSLRRLLAEGRGLRNPMNLPDLTVEQVLAWADAHRRHTRKWPTKKSGPVAGVLGETWRQVDLALRNGYRGLPRGSSLPRLLAAHRGVRNRKDPPPLTVEQILAWADAHFLRTGKWPTHNSGRIRGASGETWRTVDKALRGGSRGLGRKSSLSRLLRKHRRIAAATVPLPKGRTADSR